MKTTLTYSPLRAILAVAALSVLTLSASAREHSSAAALERQLAHDGSIQLHAVGPYVESGTYRVQVAVKLGSPTFVLPDGTWLYQGYRIDDSDASGTLVVRFEQGRVSRLSLANPQTIARLRAAPSNANRTFLAANDVRR